MWYILNSTSPFLVNVLSQFPEVPPGIMPSKRFPPINLVRKVVFPELAKIMEERIREVK